MNKSDIIRTVSMNYNLETSEAERLISLMLNQLRSALLERSRIEIRGFGSFIVKEYQGYQGRNPRTGELIEVKAKRVPCFKPGKQLLQMLNKPVRGRKSAKSGADSATSVSSVTSVRDSRQ